MTEFGESVQYRVHVDAWDQAIREVAILTNDEVWYTIREQVAEEVESLARNQVRISIHRHIYALLRENKSG